MLEGLCSQVIAKNSLPPSEHGVQLIRNEEYTVGKR